MACEMFSNRNANGLHVCTLTGLEQNLADEMQGAPDGVNVAVGRPLQFKLFLARHNIKGSFKEVIVKLRAFVSWFVLGNGAIASQISQTVTDPPRQAESGRVGVRLLPRSQLNSNTRETPI